MSRASTPAKPATQTQTQTSMPKIPMEKIAMRAYDKWCKRGQPQGTSVQDWLEAEKELMTECAKSTKK